MRELHLTLRTLLAYLDDTLNAEQARLLGQKVADSDSARVLVERIKKVTRRRGLTTPHHVGDDHDVSDPNTVAEYLSDNLDGPQLRELEETCLDSDVHLAEVAACHQILTLVLTTPVRVPPSANQRMYQIVESPAGDPSKRPGKTIPVGGVAPPRADQPEADDPDAALLLGMKRYGASDSWAGRIGLVGAVAAVAASLVLAVLMSLPRHPPAGPETSTPVQYAAVPPPKLPDVVPTPGGTPIAPDPKPADPKPADPKIDMPDPMGKKPVDPKVDVPDPKADPGPKLGDPVKAPQGGDEILGELTTKPENAIVLTRDPAPNASWLRVDPTKPIIKASTTVMALPGYRADVKLTNVTINLWGNVPEQVAMKAMVLQSKVKFHPPTDDFAADLTLEAGRIYLKTTRAGGAKVRVRVASEVWDIALKSNQTDVFIQVHTAFIPGDMFSRVGGVKPKTEVHFGVIGGTAEVRMPARFKTIEGIQTGTELAWDSVMKALPEKKPLMGDLFPDRLPALEAEFGKGLQKVLSDAATKLTNPDGTWILLKERLTAQPPILKSAPTPLQFLAIAFPVQWATYALAAIMDGPDAPEMIKDVIDNLKDPERGYARQAAVVALSTWIAQAPGNTDLLMKAMITKGWREEDVELIARLLRGYASKESGDTMKLDELIEYLNYPSIAVREIALGNLYAFFDPEAAGIADLRIDVLARQLPEAAKAWEHFLKAWKARGEEIKKKMEKK